MKVINMLSTRNSGAHVANQFIITDGSKEIFQSYRSTIAIKDNGAVILDETHWNYSRTTSKYLCAFLEETTQEIKQKIKDGVYTFQDLNND